MNSVSTWSACGLCRYVMTKDMLNEVKIAGKSLFLCKSCYAEFLIAKSDNPYLANTKRLIDADELIRNMKERDDDNGGEPLNAVDRGYHLCFEHMCKEIEQMEKIEIPPMEEKDEKTI